MTERESGARRGLRAAAGGSECAAKKSAGGSECAAKKPAGGSECAAKKSAGGLRCAAADSAAGEDVRREADGRSPRLSLFYDLHIHSCLSPCGSDDMTPYNIAGMAAVKGLNVIAVTDHNSCKNCPAVLSAAEEYGILAVPGMELCTSEEVHAVCLFGELDDAMAFDSYVYERLLPVKNRVDIFGKQEIYDCSDRVCGTVENLLINSTDISFEGLWELVRSYGGVMFPAHIDKSSNSLISNLGFVPEDSRFQTAEVKDLRKLHALLQKNPYLSQCRIISNSDAHYLEDINEPHLTVEAEEKSARAVVRALLRAQVKAGAVGSR